MANERLPLLPLILGDVPQGLRQALAQEGIPVRDRQPGPPQGRFLLFDSRAGAEPPAAAGQVGIDVAGLRRVSAGDPFEELMDERSDRYQWRIGGLALTEQIARIDKRALRQKVLEKLRGKIEQAGGIWLCVSAFPFPYRSALSFRIDYDQYDPSDFDAVLGALAGHEQATSHFVNGAAYEGAGDALARLRGLHVGSHGYWHHTYCTLEENLANVRRGIETLRAAGIEPSGFAAPLGRFNRGLLSALELLGVSFSSEFGLAYDELPFFAGSGKVLQIPVHPVCLGLFLEAARRDSQRRGQPAEAAAQAAMEQAIEYFDGLVRARYRSGQPVFLYGHPTGRLGRCPQLLRQVFAAVSHFGALWKTNFAELSRWWRARDQVRLAVLRRHDQYVVVVGRTAPGYRVGIEYWRERHAALMPVQRGVLRFSPAALAYEARAPQPTLTPARIDQPEGLRGRVRRLIDWERVTPIDQIGPAGWRNWAKRTLRRFWSDPL